MFTFPCRDIGGGCYLISAYRARKLTKPFGGLPRPGYEREVILEWEGKHPPTSTCITQTTHNGLLCWAVRAWWNTDYFVRRMP